MNVVNRRNYERPGQGQAIITQEAVRTDRTFCLMGAGLTFAKVSGMVGLTLIWNANDHG